MLSSARVRPNVILAGVNGHRHSSKSFSENVVVAKTRYQMLGILPFSDRKRALFPSTGKSELTVEEKIIAMMFSGGVYF